MKTYICDSCETLIDHPYKQKMREFCVGVDYSESGVFPINAKHRVKIHLCDQCYHALQQIANKKSKGMNAVNTGNHAELS